MIFNMTGGGNPLNFKVVGGATEPSNPKENTIWVNTDKEITGWHFASEQPEDMKEGEVWFQTGSYSPSEFNALKKNNVTVYPISAKQMVSGALKDVVAKTYQGGKWVDWWNGALFDNGDENIGVTGGWVKYACNNVNLGFQTVAGIVKNGVISLTGAHLTSSVLGTANKIDLTSFSTIRWNGESIDQNTAYGVYLRVCTERNIDIKVAESRAFDGYGGFELTLDISNLSGEYYICVTSDCPSYGRVNKIFLEA